MSAADLVQVLDNLVTPRVLVLGDLILDRYTWGNAERISQEAPVLLLRADRREQRLGGAANVCQMLAGLDAVVTCAGVVGDDEAGSQVRQLLNDVNIDHTLVLTDPSRPTTCKERFIGRAANRHPHQILRVDSEERDPLSPQLETELLQSLLSKVASFDVVLISDYDKGVCTPALLAELISAARAAGVPVVVDPAPTRDYTLYRGATTMTPNRTEAFKATGLAIQQPEDAVAVGKRLIEIADLDMAIVTLDRDGMCLVHRDGRAGLYPTTPRQVYDITGAGDMVMATIGICLAGRVPAELAVRLANITGGLEVEQVGVAVIPRSDIRAHLIGSRIATGSKLLPREELARQIASCRDRGQRIVFTNGCFDLLHVGHVTYLQEAAAQGDVLVIAINSDSSVRQLKGPTRPVIKQQDRAAMLTALACVDFAVVFDEPTCNELISLLKPDVVVKGGDYKPEQIPERETIESYGGRLYIAGLVQGVSTTTILKSVAA